LGFIVALIGFSYAGWVIINALIGRPASGWSSLMVVVLVVGGIQMVMMGVLGEYLWRALDEARRRPRYILEAVLEAESSQSGDYRLPATDGPPMNGVLAGVSVGSRLLR
jgi:dolichol-phosphate mannosyltransferase